MTKDQNQLALVPLKSSDSLEVSLAQFDGDEVLVEDWVLDTYSEDVELPLAVEPLAFSLTLGHERTRNCGCGEFCGCG